jgi:hypothetical protein
MMITVFWDTAPSTLTHVYRRFRGAYCFHNQSNADTIHTSETSVKTLRCNIPEGCHLEVGLLLLSSSIQYSVHISDSPHKYPGFVYEETL